MSKLSNLSWNNEDEQETETGQSGIKKAKKKSPSSKLADIIKILKLIRAKKMIPAIIFAFSKKEVELLAKSISKSMEFLN